MMNCSRYVSIWGKSGFFGVTFIAALAGGPKHGKRFDAD